MMKKLKCNSQKGFTLWEILIVIIIIGILVAIAIPVYSDVADNARNSVCKYNGSYIVRVMALNISRYDPEDRYAPRNSGAQFDYSEDSLSNYLEKNLENYQANSNKDRIMNPVSRSKTILNANSPASENDPAVFITGNSTYSYSGTETDDLRGTIVVYFNASDPYNIQIYYVDKERTKVELVAEFH